MVEIKLRIRRITGVPLQLASSGDVENSSEGAKGFLSLVTAWYRTCLFEGLSRILKKDPHCYNDTDCADWASTPRL